jgi:DHA3 family multidrug efflux protein-like MFS transporter
VPGLFALIFFACFNNFLGGVFRALLDAYGLSTGGSGGVGPPVRRDLDGVHPERDRHHPNGLGEEPDPNAAAGERHHLVGLLRVHGSAVDLALAAGCFVWMLLGPYAEAAEHTTLQKVVPLERQGRVFGFAQSVEQSASPVTAFLIGPLTQFIVIPFMTDGAGADAIGDWFGTGPDRGIALVFTVAGLIGLLVTILAFNSSYYRQLSAAYAKAKTDDGDAGEAAVAGPA